MIQVVSETINIKTDNFRKTFYVLKNNFSD